MIEMGKKYQTRDGRAVEILRTGLYCDSPFNVLGIIWKGDGKCIVEAWTPEGKTTHDSIVYNNDLIPIPTKHEGWVLLNKYGNVAFRPVCFPTKENAEDVRVSAFCPEYWVVAHVTWED